MDFLNTMLHNIEYRDPLFGIIVLIFFIGVASLLGYYWNYIIQKKQQNSLSKFIESFDYIGFDKFQSYVDMANKNIDYAKKEEQ